MIARIWHGTTPAEKANDYLEFLKNRAILDYEGADGCLDVNILHRIEEDVVHFKTLTFWTSEEAIKIFAGNDVLKAKYYPEDEDFLLELEEYVCHYQVTKK